MDINSLLQDSGIPKSALALLKLQQEENKKQRELGMARSAGMREMSQQDIVNPFMAAMSGLASAAPGENIWGGAGKAATQAMMENAKNRQALKLKADEVDAEGQSLTGVGKLLPELVKSQLGSAGSAIWKRNPQTNEFEAHIGDRLFKMGKDGKPEEVVSSLRTIPGIDNVVDTVKANVAEQFKLAKERGFFDGPDAPSPEAWVADAFDRGMQEAMRTIRKTQGATPAPAARANEAPAPVPVPAPVPAPVAAPAGPLAAVPPELVSQRDAAPVGSPERMAANQQVAGARKGAGLPSAAEMERRGKNATGSEDMAMKHYETNILPMENSARSMLNTIAGFRAIPVETGAFAEWRSKIGGALADLGYKGDIAKDAPNYESARGLLQKVANDVLMAAKGVQTDGDAQRAFKQFAQITDTPAAVEFLTKWAEELSTRAKFKGEFYRAHNAEKKTWQGAEEAWSKSSDYVKAAPIKIIKGIPRNFTEYKTLMVKKNPDMGIDDILKNWNSFQ